MKQFLKNNWIKACKDQRGSSIIVVLIAIAFVTVLVSIILTSSMTMIQMKNVNNHSKDNFYDADAVVDEIYAEVGQECFQNLEDVFIKTASEMFSTTDNTFATNDALNEKMKKAYFDAVSQCLAGCNADQINTNSLSKDNCQAYLTRIVNTKLKSSATVTVGSIRFDAVNNTIVLKDVTITVVDGEYKSSVITDLVISYPLKENISFLKEGDDTDNYLQYALVGLQSVDFKDCTTLGGNLSTTITGNVFAGDLIVGPLNYVTMQDGTLINSSKTFVNTKSGTEGNVAYTASLNLKNVKLWTRNIVAGVYGNGYENNSANFVAENSNLYVADDLTLEGNNAIANVDGNYYGFMKKSGAEGSSVIVNGQNCSLNIQYNELLVAGESVIKETGYQTFDSLGIKGIQELYLVPANYLEVNANPSDRLEKVEMYSFTEDNKFASTSFFACQWLDIVKGDSAKNGYEIIHTPSGVYYYYLKFKDEASEMKYLESIINFDANNRRYSYHEGGSLVTVVVTNEAVFADLTNLQKILRTCSAKFGTVGFSAKSGSSVLSTRGNLLKIIGASLQTASRGTGSLNILDSNHLNASENVSDSVMNYYTIMQNYLGYSSTAILDGIDIYQRSIDVNAIKKTDSNVIVPSTSDDQIVAVIRKGNNNSTSSYTIEKKYTKGLVLAYNMDIILDHDFEGLIFTNRNIYIKEDASHTINIKSNSTLIKNILVDNYATYRDVAKYFRKFTQEGDELTLDPVGIEDMVHFENWRKNYGE